MVSLLPLICSVPGLRAPSSNLFFLGNFRAHAWPFANGLALRILMLAPKKKDSHACWASQDAHLAGLSGCAVAHATTRESVRRREDTASVGRSGWCVCLNLFSFYFLFFLYIYIWMYVSINFYLSTSLFYITFSYHQPISLSLEMNNYTHDQKNTQCFFNYSFIIF